MEPSKQSLLTYLVKFARDAPGKRLLGGMRGWRTTREVLAQAEAAACRLRALGIREGGLTAPSDQDAQAPSFIIFTSGSTGRSKAVMLSQYNLVSNLPDPQPLGCYEESDIALEALPLDLSMVSRRAGMPVVSGRYRA